MDRQQEQEQEQEEQEQEQQQTTTTTQLVSEQHFKTRIHHFTKARVCCRNELFQQQQQQQQKGLQPYKRNETNETKRNKTHTTTTNETTKNETKAHKQTYLQHVDQLEHVVDRNIKACKAVSVQRKAPSNGVGVGKLLPLCHQVRVHCVASPTFRCFGQHKRRFLHPRPLVQRNIGLVQRFSQCRKLGFPFVGFGHGRVLRAQQIVVHDVHRALQHPHDLKKQKQKRTTSKTTPLHC